jgi:hypothetical protein
MNLAHVFFYERIHGPVPEGLELDHLCEVPLCINPNHLEAVTHTINMRRCKIIKLSMEIAREIRAAYEAAPRKFGMQSILGRKYGYPPQNIGLILKNRIWREEA